MSGVYDFNLRVLYPYLPTLGWGAVQTLEISALAILLSFPLGLIGALMRISGSRVLRGAATTYVEVVRNIPLLVVLYVLFYVLPLYKVPINAFTAGVLGLTINSTAFTIEIFRGGFSAIPAGQYEAARALGLGRAAIFRLIVVPQVFRIDIAEPRQPARIRGARLGAGLDHRGRRADLPDPVDRLEDLPLFRALHDRGAVLHRLRPDYRPAVAPDQRADGAGAARHMTQGGI